MVELVEWRREHAAAGFYGLDQSGRPGTRRLTRAAAGCSREPGTTLAEAADDVHALVGE